MKKYVIKIDLSKFTPEELEQLEEFRQLAIRLKVLERYFFRQQIEATSKKEVREWQKCIDLLDELRCDYDDLLFRKFPQLPDKAVHCFY